jgi:nitrate reductase gamma subunit
MNLLEFARGPALQLSLLIFVFGTVWRLLGLVLLPTRQDLSEPRNKAAWKGLRLIALRSWPRKEFLSGAVFGEAMGYTFHAGYLLVLLFFAPHVLFIADILRIPPDVLSGRLSWPALPTGVVTLISAVSLAALVALLIHRLTNPVKRLISNFDDYFSWFLTAAPLVTGIAASAHLAAWPYERLLAIHILSAELLLVWFPFGKLMHAFTIFASRGLTGVLFERKGASL